ncbi:DUF3368 domain-containing protein [Aequorivita todarodis]|uniref:DUF3368 domain-containing protein n=1 Tax=Aequorivita todarodis TaxID=2036821 RepID=UPI002350F980|nr:DUF3368 domain-containing protein [Aequorivita todarodis]MDC8002371.1 DUF3368 domain-containing protein [Aequorivita todarodis]
MPKTIISDTSCFIILTNIGELDILRKVYGEVITTPEVASEFGEPLPAWVIIKSATDYYRQAILEVQIDKGESSAIALALEIETSTVILDDLKDRKMAEHLGISYTGTIGVVKAKLKGVIPSIKPILKKLKQTDFRISLELETEALGQAKELP